MNDLSKIASPGAADKLMELVLKGFGPSVEQIGLIGGDLVREIRWNNLRRIQARMRKKLEDAGKKPKTIPPRLLVPILESASIEDDETLQDMWAGLLATASAEADKVSPSYVETLKQLAPNEARFLDELYRSRTEEARKSKHGITNLKIAPGTFYEVRRLSEGPNMTRVNAETFERLGLMRRDYGLARGDIPGEQEVGFSFELTRYAMKFLRACRGEFDADPMETWKAEAERLANALSHWHRHVETTKKRLMPPEGEFARIHGAHTSGCYSAEHCGENPEFAAPGEIEEYLRRSVRLNNGLFEPADWLAIILTEQRQYADAVEVVSAVQPRLTDRSAVRGRKAWIRREAGEKKEATRDLAQVLKDFPGYPWGWNVLLAWIEEDRDWEFAKTLLGPLPAQMLSDVSFRRKRLQVLGKAKADSASIDAEWAQLLDDFPENVPLYLNRYDSLHEAGRSDEATAILVRIAPYADDDVYFWHGW